MASKEDTYLFVKIPADESEPLVEISKSKAGGLSEDTLIAHARQSFDGALCDISALTIPKSQNNYTGVSMYHFPSNKTPNKRATALANGCGLTTTNIQGDAFVGRYYDNEERDIWERRDFLITDAHPSATWCVQARQDSGGSTGRGSSLSGILQQQLQGSNTTVLQPPSNSNNAFGTNGSCVKEDWGRWSQTDEEVELQFPVDSGISSKDVQIVFKRSGLSVKIENELVLTGSLFNPVVVDECTYTLQTDDDGKRTVCVSLLKFQTGSTWSYAVMT